MYLYCLSYREITPSISVNQRVLANGEKESSEYRIARGGDDTIGVTRLALALRYHVKCEYLESHMAVSVNITIDSKSSVNLRV